MAVPFVAALREWRERLWVTAVSGALGVVAGLALTGGTVRGLLQGTLTGVFASIFVQARDRLLDRIGVGRWPFGLFLAASTLTMVAAICLALAAAALPWLATEGLGDGRIYVFAFLCSVVISLGFSTWFALDRLLGGDVLVGLLTGRYHRPRHEERIFLFADLEGSTAVAARLGELRYHTFLNRAFVDLAGPVNGHAGAIYQYVGDEMVVTWPVDRGSRDGKCFRCAQAMLDALESGADDYAGEFGVAPRVRVALHCGPVVAGEIGDLRREIVYAGDALNTAARIEAAAKEGGHAIVASADLLRRAPLPEGLSARSLGSHTFRGRDAPLELFSLEREPG